MTGIEVAGDVCDLLGGIREFCVFVLAIDWVADQEHAPVAKIGDQTGSRIVSRDPEHRSDRRGDHGGIREGAQIDECDGTSKCLDQIMRHRDGHRCFAHATGSHDRDESRIGEPNRDLARFICPANHSRQAARQSGIVETRGTA